MTDYIEVSATRVVCSSHGEHLRAKWPTGFAVVSLIIVQKALEGEALLKAVDPDWDGTEKGAVRLDVAKVNAITERRPFCYFITREEIREAFHEAEFLSIGRCDTCGRSGLGGPYKIALPIGDQQRWLCLECALDAGEREHQVRPKGVKR